MAASHNKSAQSRAKESHFLCHFLSMFTLPVVVGKGWATSWKPGQISVMLQQRVGLSAFMTVASVKLIPTHKMPFNYDDWLVPWWISTLVCSPVTCWHFMLLDLDNAWRDICSGIPVVFQLPPNLQSCRAAQCFRNTQNQLLKPTKFPVACISMLLLLFPSRIR